MFDPFLSRWRPLIYYLSSNQDRNCNHSIWYFRLTFWASLSILGDIKTALSILEHHPIGPVIISSLLNSIISRPKILTSDFSPWIAKINRISLFKYCPTTFPDVFHRCSRSDIFLAEVIPLR
jgi:hypothetical protein